MNTVYRAQGERRPPMLPGPTGMKRFVQHDESTSLFQTQLLQMVGRRQASLAGADHDDLSFKYELRHGLCCCFCFHNRCKIQKSLTLRGQGFFSKEFLKGFWTRPGDPRIQ